MNVAGMRPQPRSPPDNAVMKIVIAVVFAGILVALALAGQAMRQNGRPGPDGKARPNRMAHALAWRIGLSVALFLFVLVAYKLGWIQPTGLPVPTR